MYARPTPAHRLSAVGVSAAALVVVASVHGVSPSEAGSAERGRAQAGGDARPPGALDDELLSSIQGLLAVQRLDGWLLHDDDGRNPVASELVSPSGAASARWFFYIPAAGEPAAVVHEDDVAAFAGVPGRVVAYRDHDELSDALASALAGASRVAMEHDPDRALPSLDRVDAGTIDFVRQLGVELRSSADLVQNTVARWLPEGRIAHYVAVHHLVALRDDALRFIGERVRAGDGVTEGEVRTRLERGFERRGLEGPPPRVAIDAHTADPGYVPDRDAGAPIQRGDLLVIDLAARVAGHERPIYADMAWTAYVGDEIPDRHRELFWAVAQARDAAIDLLRERAEAGQGVRGYEVDRRARQAAARAGYEDAWAHRTGHSLGLERPGPGAYLDDGDARDPRALARDSGVAVGPGLYERGVRGARTQVGVYLEGRSVEITGPLQEQIIPILRP